MQAPAATPHPPPWIIYASFAISLVLAILKIKESFPQPSLEIQLTRDLFFRLVEAGEALFCNAALLATDRPILITGVRPMLKRLAKTGRTHKSFELDIINHGEKVKGSQSMAEHQFFGSSPLQYVSSGAPLRAVYLCVYGDYADNQRIAYQAFQADIRSALESNKNVDLSDPEQSETFRTDIEGRIERHYNAMLHLSQLEAGDYELNVDVTYRSAKPLFKKRTKKASSRVTFTIEEQAIDLLRKTLRQSLTTVSQELLGGTTASHAYPELSPTSVKEVPAFNMP